MMIKIAAVVDSGNIAGHFGFCEGFMLLSYEGEKLVAEEYLKNPEHKPGFLPNYLNDHGVNVIIAGGMGDGAVNKFIEKNIEVILGATGDAKIAAENYIKGELKTSGSICREHHHRDECDK